MNYIIKEIKSCSNNKRQVKDVDFTQDGGKFRIQTHVQGEGGKEFECDVSTVDVFVVKRTVIAKSDSVEVFDLYANKYGAAHHTEAIVTDLLNRTKLECLARAFTHLSELETGKKRLFTSQMGPE